MTTAVSSRLKVMTVVGTRPEVIRLSRVIAVLAEVAEHRLVHTGQNHDYELNGIFFDELGVPAPDHVLDVAGATAAETIGSIITRVDAVFEVEKPDSVLVLGDTNSCLAVIAAKRRRIPIFHMEAGNRCFDMRVPEEINRRIVDHVSDINLCYTEHGRRNLLAEGLPADQIIKTGSPMKEVLDHHQAEIDASDIHRRLDLTPGKYLTVSLHREENVDDPAQLAKLVEALNALAGAHSFPLIFSLHPRTRARLEASGHRLHQLVRTLPPLGFFDYNALQKRAFCALSDSGTITEESALLGFPAVTLREAHERPEGMDAGVLIMCGVDPLRILRAVEVTAARFRRRGPSSIPPDYDVAEVSWKVANIILSYTDYVNRKVWHCG